MRYFFEVAYHGKAYNGWQNQQNGIGVQSVIENALSKLMNEKVDVVGSGRTDTGVHCQQQFFHADLAAGFDRSSLLQKLNSFLPGDIAIYNIVPVRDDASARYDAIERTYQYRITQKKNPFMNGLALHFYKPLNMEAMNEAAKHLVGEFDFACFSKVKTDVPHFLCNIRHAAWEKHDHLLAFTISANRFLRGMVRAIVGTLLDVGEGKRKIEEVPDLIKGKDRRKAGANVPPYGLYLMSVRYPDRVYLSN